MSSARTSPSRAFQEAMPMNRSRRRLQLPLGAAILLVVLMLALGRLPGNAPATPPTAELITVTPAAAAAAPAQAIVASATATRSPATPAASTAPPAGLTIPTPPPGEGLATVRYEHLPPEGREVIRLIARGGPFPYRQDGTTFQNRERLLPGKPSGYYKEYTVVTPGSPDRGARRIVAGTQGELYYTADHYASFRRVVP